MISLRHLVLSSLISLPLISALSQSLKQSEIIVSTERSSIYALEDLQFSYSVIDPELSINLVTNSQSEMFDKLINQQIDLAMTTISMPATVIDANPQLKMIPFLLTGLAPFYRLDSLGSSKLRLSRATIIGIFIGEINQWNHPMIIADNPSINLPNQNITMILEKSESSRSAIIKRALSKFSPQKFNQSGQSISPISDWPYEKYANFVNVIPSTTALVAGVLAYDGSFSIGFHSVVLELGAKVADMVNKAGATVSISPASLTLAATEMSTNLEGGSNTAADLIDPSNVGAWPMATYSYLVIDTTNSRTTCRAKKALVEVLLYFYRSSVSSSLLVTRGYSAVPSLVMDRLSVFKLLIDQIMCRGSVALPPQITSTRLVGVAQQELFLANLFTSVYLNVDPSVTFAPQLVKSYDLIVNQLISGEIDVGLLNTDNVSPNLLKQFLNTEDFLLLPFYAEGLGWLINPQLTDTVKLPTNQPFKVSTDMLVRFIGGCVTQFSDPKILALNSWLSPYIANKTSTIEYIWACSGLDNIGSYISQKAYMDGLMGGLFGDVTDRDSLEWCFSEANPGLLPRQHAYESCSAAPDWHLRYSKDEYVGPSLVMGINGATGPAMVDMDPAKIWASFPVTKNGVTKWVEPDYDNIAACIYDGITHSGTFDFTRSQSPDCWPYTQGVILVVRKKYYSTASNTSSCTRGLDALKFARYLSTTRSIDQLLVSSNKVLIPKAVAGIDAKYLDALNQVVCDSDTLLITLPVIWELSSGLVGFGYAASSIGIFVTLIYIAFVIFYHRHPTIRASSPLFILTSLFGVLMMFGAIIALIQPVTNSSCAGLAWMFSVGLMVTFAPLFAKTWRVYKIFGGKKLSVVKISNRKLMMIVMCLFVVETILMVIWQAVAPLEALLTDVSEGYPARQHHYVQCSADGLSSSLLVAVAIEKGALLLGGALLGFSTRKVSSQFNESSQIALSIYNTVFTIGVIGAILGVLEMNGDVRVGLMLVIALWISFFTGAILVVPKALHIFNPDDKDGRSVTGSSGNSSSGFSFISANVFTSLAMVNGYLSALRRHVEQIEHKQASLRGVPTSGSQKKLVVMPSNASKQATQNGATPTPTSAIQSHYSDALRAQKRGASLTAHELAPCNAK